VFGVVTFATVAVDIDISMACIYGDLIRIIETGGIPRLVHGTLFGTTIEVPSFSATPL